MLMITLLMMNLAGATAAPSGDCEEQLSPFRLRLLSYLSEASMLRKEDHEHARVRRVEVLVRSGILTWDLGTNQIREQMPEDKVPGALVSKASGDTIVVLYPSASAREVQRLEGASAVVSFKGQTFGWLRGKDWQPVRAERPLPLNSASFGKPWHGSLYGEPVLFWRKTAEGRRDRVFVTTYDQTLISNPDVVELWDGSRVTLHNSQVVSHMPPDRRMREYTAEMEPSPHREFFRENWRALQFELNDYPIIEMRESRISRAVINGNENLFAMIGPVRNGRSWVVVIDPVTRLSLRPDNETNALIGPKMIDIKRAELADGRRLIPGFMTWSVRGEPGGDDAMAVATPRPPASPGGAAVRVRLRELVD